MTTSIFEQEYELRNDTVKSDIAEQPVEPIIYFRLGEENPLLTWKGLYRLHQS